MTIALSRSPSSQSYIPALLSRIAVPRNAHTRRAPATNRAIGIGSYRGMKMARSAFQMAVAETQQREKNTEVVRFWKGTARAILHVPRKPRSRMATRNSPTKQPTRKHAQLTQRDRHVPEQPGPRVGCSRGDCEAIFMPATRLVLDSANDQVNAAGALDFDFRTRVTARSRSTLGSS